MEATIPANVAAAAQTKARLRRERVTFAAVQELARQAQLLDVPAKPCGWSPTIDEDALVAACRRSSGLGRSTWYVHVSDPSWRTRLDTDLDDLSRTVREERRLPRLLEHGPDGAGPTGHSGAPATLLMGLALHAARPASGPHAGVFNEYRRQDMFTLLDRAGEILVKEDWVIRQGMVDRLRQVHRWLVAADDGFRSQQADPEQRLSGFLAAWDSAHPDISHERVVDPGTWIEGAVTCLVARDRYEEAAELAAGYDAAERLHWGVMPPADYLLERLLLKSLEGGTAGRRARDVGARLARDRRLAPTGDGSSSVRARVEAVRSFLLRQWPAALAATLTQHPGKLVRPEVEREYGFSTLAAIAHECATKGKGTREEPGIAAFLHRAREAGRGAFMEAVVRQLAGELEWAEGEPQDLAELVAGVVPDEAVGRVAAAVRAALVARAFNDLADLPSRSDVEGLRVRLEQHARDVAAAAKQLATLERAYGM